MLFVFWKKNPSVNYRFSYHAYALHIAAIVESDSQTEDNDELLQIWLRSFHSQAR